MLLLLMGILPMKSMLFLLNIKLYKTVAKTTGIIYIPTKSKMDKLSSVATIPFAFAFAKSKKTTTFKRGKIPKKRASVGADFLIF